jgi:hypothetical protein
MHEHAHHHAYGPTGRGAVLADLGEDRGALVLYVPEERRGEEIEISADPLGAVRTHVAVRERRIGTNAVFAAFYPSLPAGEHTIWQGPIPIERCTIRGGEVTTVDWRAEGV